MLKRLIVGVLGVVSSSVMMSAQPDHRGPDRVIVAAEKHDVSARLRDVRPIPPAKGHDPDEREPGPFRRTSSTATAPTIDTVVQSVAPTAAAPAPSFTVEGIGNVNGVLPPDTNGDIGPNHYVQWVNLSFAVFARDPAGGAPTLVYGPAAGSTLWKGFGGPCETTNNGDPIVLYDHLADRWVMSQLALPNLIFGVPFGPFYQCIAVSATPDPLGAYYRYQYAFAKLNDYPKLAVWPDAYYMTMNQFAAGTLQFAGQGVVAFDRAAMLSGGPASMVYVDLASVDLNLGGMLPADLDGPAPPPGSPDYFVQVDDNAWNYTPNDQLQLWKFHVDWTNPSASSFTRAAVLLTEPFDSNMCGYARNCIPQPGTTAKVDALADRLMYRLQYRNFGDHESLVVNHTVDADGTDHGAIRWYELRDPSGTPFIYQQGPYAPDSDNRWMGSAALDSAGDLAIGFSVSSATTFPSIRYTGRLASDPPGLLTQTETTLMAGNGSQTHSSGRWGDYSLLTVDPTDDCTFWYTQEYYSQTSEAGWQTRIGSFRFPTCQAPSDFPYVTVATNPSSVTEGGGTAAAFIVSRTGDTTAPLTVTYSISGSATPNVDYQALPGTVVIPAGAASASISVMPIDDTVYEGPETVSLTIEPDPTYRPRSPSNAVVTIVDDDLPPDLVVSSVSVPAMGGAGLTVTITDTTANQGSGAAAGSKTSFYLSTNKTYESGDVLLGSRTISALPAATASTGTTAITIPSGTTAGTYYVVAVADSDGVVAESVETNNVASSAAIAVGPDLTITALTGPATAAAGGTIVINDTTSDQGGGAAGASVTRFYLSTQPYMLPSSVALGSRSVASLGPQTASSASTTVTIPSTVAAGTYFVLASADADGVVPETNENNNTKSGPIVRVGPDLVVSLAVPASAGPGDTISVTDKTTDQGAGAVTVPTTTTFYLSVNGVFDSSDAVIGSRAVAPIAAGGSDTATTAVTLPTGLAPGTYYLFALADSSKAVPEWNESNNASAAQGIRIGPDLVITALTGPSAAAPGSNVALNDTTMNQGGAVAGSSETRFYLSTNFTLDSADILIGSRSVSPLAAGASESASTTVTIPANVPVGSYYLLAQADGANAVAETSETNNTRAGSVLRIGPDLTVSRLGGPLQVVAGSTISLTDTTVNLGSMPSTISTSTAFYLSTNLALDASDTLLGTRVVPPLDPGASSAATTTVVVPATMPAGTYCIIAKADALNGVLESNETNNVSYALIITVTRQ